MHSKAQFGLCNQNILCYNIKLCLEMHGKYIFTQEVSTYKVYSMTSMNRIHLFLTVNTIT